MKAIKLLISMVLVLTIVGVVESCKSKGEDPGPGPVQDTEAARVTKLLTSATWKLNSVTVDGVSKNMFSGMTLTFSTANGYTATKGDPVWTSTGTWSFTDDTAKGIIRNDQTIVNVESIDDNNVTLSLIWSKTTLGAGRVESIPGKHVFVFGK
jgi:hypothetical protein